MSKKTNARVLMIKTAICFVVALILSVGCCHIIYQVQKKEAKMNATYTAESTIRKVELQISRYLENSDLFRNIISSGYTINDEQFADLAGFMIKDKSVIEAYELAPEGIVRQAYPLKGNEEAIGLNMLENPDRTKEATLAKNSEKYTIAGPFELKQGGTGALLFDPIYIGEGKDKTFWGFSILVLNWQNFLKELQIEKLSEADYHFYVWKNDTDGDMIKIMDCGHGHHRDALQVPCSVPNDTWYFEIMPKSGWISMSLRVLGYILSALIAMFVAIVYWQKCMRKHREAVYAEQLEKSAKEAQEANEAKTRFLFNMSHDIRTPMNAIVGYSELLDYSLDDKKAAREYISKIKISNSMLLSLINYILEMARIESGKIVLKQEKGNLRIFADMLKVVTEPQIEEKKIECSWTLDVKHEDIICDITKVREIVMNIISNAIKYTPEGGKIDFSITELASDSEKTADYCFVVEDNGIGMHKDYLPHIFEEFSREHTTTESKVSGVGLGLPIVKALVDMMHGRIDVDSELNHGTKFSIYLTFPIVQANGVANEEMRQPEKHRQESTLAGKRILLTEDNELNIEIAKEILTRQGAIVDVAEDGSECIACLEEKPDNYYDLILMDIQIPVMNGYETTIAIRNSNKPYASIPIAAMTANAFEEDKERALQAGMNAHIAKPVDVKKIIEVLSEII